MKTIREGKAIISIKESKKISKEMEVFYNPVMKFNRDISILLLNIINKNNLDIALPLAATGIRGIRFILESKKDKIKKIYFNDVNRKAYKLIKSSLKKNKIKESNRIKVFNEEANLFLLKNKPFDYIDIDPFGSPNPFLDSAIKSLKNNSIIAVTATDISGLAGTHPKACLRKYWAKPYTPKQKNSHEYGLRILIRKVQMIASQYSIALKPIFSYSKEHYMRIFFISKNGKKETDNLLKNHKIVMDDVGPLWIGNLYDRPLVKNMLKDADDELKKFLSIIYEESKINVVGFYNIHKLCKKYKIDATPKITEIIDKLKQSGFKASRTHFNPVGIKTNASVKDIISVMKRM